MKRNHELIASVVIGMLWPVFAQAANTYWDTNGSTPGAGNPANSVSGWELDTFWSGDSGGSSATAAWVEGSTAVFSAGTDALDPYTVTIAGSVTPLGITFEEGVPTLSGGTINMTNVAENVGDFPIIANTNATIDSGLNAPSCGFKKNGSGWLTLGGDNNTAGLNGTNTIVEGGVVATHAYAFGGSTATPTIVSNGATIQANIAGVADTIILNGNGVTNGGAFRDALPGNGGCPSQIILGSDAKMLHVTSVNFSFTGQYLDGTNNANGFANLTIDGDAGGFHRFNIGGYPAIRLGKGALIKEGLCTHNFEVPNDIGAIYFNRGNLNWRQGGGGGTGVVYVAATAGQFRSSAPNVTFANNVVLASGANPGIHVFTGTGGGGPFGFSGIISGPGGITTTSNGIVRFNNANTYTGNTTIGYGTLALGAGGSIASSPVIELQNNGIFDVSAVTGGYVLGASQTLKGNGYVGGNVTANGTLAPGASIGSLTFSNDLTVSKLLIDVDKSLSPSNDVIAVMGALSAGSGTLTVNNLGSSLMVGDTFYLFQDGAGNNKGVSGGGSLAVSGGGATWNNNLAADGSISVASLVPVTPATNLTVAAVGPNSIGIGGVGAASAPYDVYAYTNVATPMSNWWKLGTTNASAGGVIQFVDSQATNAYRFYRFGQPSP